MSFEMVFDQIERDEMFLEADNRLWSYQRAGVRGQAFTERDSPSYWVMQVTYERMMVKIKAREVEYKRVLEALIARYQSMLTDHLVPDIKHFLHEFLMKLDEYPIEKLNRWIGYIQCYVINQGFTTVEAERDFTRPLFRPLDFPS